MPTAMDLLSTEICDDILTVDLESRRIIIPDTVENLGVESDDSVRVLHFQVPRTYCSVDLSTFAIRVNYKNTSGAGGSYDIESFAIEEGMIKFDWIVERPVTVRRGNVVFNVCFREIVNEVVEREFNTAIATLPVLEGLETGDEIATEHFDLLEQLMNGGARGQADMFEDDVNSPAHIRNRTHWHELTLGDAVIDQTVELRFSTSISIRGKIDHGLEEGNIYLIVWDGVEYRCVCGKTNTGQMYVGNRALCDTDATATDEPFCIVDLLGMQNYKVYRTGEKIDTSAKYECKVQAIHKDIWHKLDKRYIPDDLGGGVTDYNKLENKPVDEITVAGDTLTWDGNTDGLVAVWIEEGVGFCKVSDAVITKEDCANGLSLTCAGQTIDAPGEEVRALFADDGCMFTDYIAFIPADNYYSADLDVTFPEAGTYFVTETIMFTSKLVIPGYTGFIKTEIKKLDMKYLPDGYPYRKMGRKAVLPETVATVLSDGMSILTDDFALMAGKTYAVNWNGTEYTCVSVGIDTEDGVIVILGNLIVAGGPDTGEPFAMMYMDGFVEVVGGNTLLYIMDGSTSATLSIDYTGEVAYPIDNEYLEPFSVVNGKTKLKKEYLPEGMAPYTIQTDLSVILSEEISVRQTITDELVKARRTIENGGTVFGTFKGKWATVHYASPDVQAEALHGALICVNANEFFGFYRLSASHLSELQPPIRLRSPNGTLFRISVDNSGVLSATKVVT